MLATIGELPRGSWVARFGYEVKWDGVRVIAYVPGGAEPVRATGRRVNDVTARYPELAALAGQLGRHRAVLDGEVVALDEAGRPSFERLQHRMHVVPGAALLREVPVTYVVFDLLYLDGRELFGLPYGDRRELLDGLEIQAARVQTPPSFPAASEADAEDLLRATAEQGLEGVIAKRLDSTYRPGRRSGDWLKVKTFRTQDVVVVGWKPGQGRRAGGVGSLLVGVYENGELRFAGHVGTGFTDRILDETARLLAPLEVPDSPVAGGVPPDVERDAHWVRPELVGEVAYAQWTGDGRLRHPVWRGLRDDRLPHEVTREP
ncbi:MAG: DNA polymerase LigD [Streptosporangiales bacterium]|nr:DNA polymerase LigD [Streptosporangiales bacterium]